MIIHLIPDDKFIDVMIHRYEAVSSGANRYVYIGQKIKLSHVTFEGVEFLELDEVVEAINKSSCKAIVIHSLQSKAVRVLNRIDPAIRVLWCGWGFDYYDLLLKSYFPDGLILPQTRAICARLSLKTRKPLIIRAIKWAYRRVMRLIRIRPTNHVPLGRIDYFSPVLELEHQMAAEANPKLRAKYIPWNYQSSAGPENILVKECISEDSGNILVGNSATATNNHSEIFTWLAQSKQLSDRKIIVPLSYGSQDYAEEVCRLGKQLFGDNFHPLREWLSLNQYFKIIHSCDFAVFGHLRQQAAGNVSEMRRNGAKIYLHASSPLCKSLIQRGADISLLSEDIVSGAPINFNPLESNSIESNRRVGSSHLEFPPNFSRTQKVVDLLLS